jgi:O-antigen ligase
MSARLSFLVFILVAVITPLFYLKRKHSIVVFTLSILLIIVFMSTNTRMQQGLNTFKTAIEENRYTGSWGHRLGFVIVGLDILKEHPVVGRGVSDVRTRVVAYAEENPQYFLKDPARHFHNEHLQILVEVGMVGYLLYLMFLFLFLRLPISDPLINNLKYTYTIAFLLMQFGEHYLTFYATSLFIAIFFILVILYSEREKEELTQTVTS